MDEAWQQRGLEHEEADAAYDEDWLEEEDEDDTMQVEHSNASFVSPFGAPSPFAVGGPASSASSMPLGNPSPFAASSVSSEACR